MCGVGSYMRKLFFVLLLSGSLLASSNYFKLGGDFAKADTLLSYDYGIEVNLEDTTYAVYSKYRTSYIQEKEYVSINTNLIYRRKYWQVGLEYLRVDKIDVELVKLDGRLRFKGWSLGVAGVWDWDCETKVVLGKEIIKEFKFFMIPMIFNFQTNNYYPDFISTAKAELDLRLEVGVVNNILDLIDSKKRMPNVNLGVSFESFYKEELDFVSVVGIKVRF